MNFHKYTALGNDYIVIDPTKEKKILNRNMIIRLCDRNFGIGSDGILYGPFFDEGKVHLKIYNPNGLEAEKSGNGLRIFAKYLHDMNMTYDNDISIETLGGQVLVTKKDLNRYSVNLGEYKILEKDKKFIIGNEVLFGTCVDIGNPHCVLIVDRVDKNIADSFGHYIENYPDFKNKTNVQFVQILDKNNIAIEIWERGAGYTLASGTSSAAAAAALYEIGAIDSNITVHMPGGNIVVELAEGKAVIEGNVNFLFEGRYNDLEL